MTFSLQNFINQKFNLGKPIRVIYVAGLDLFNRCHGMRGLRSSNMGGVAVVYRSGQETYRITSDDSQCDPKVFYVCSNDNNMETSSLEYEDISSTLIRKRLIDNQNCDHLTFKSVLEHMKMIS